MKIISFEGAEATVILNKEDIRMFLGTIRETFEALDSSEFFTRTGFEPSEMEEVQKSLDATYEKISTPAK